MTAREAGAAEAEYGDGLAGERGDGDQRSASNALGGLPNSTPVILRCSPPLAASLEGWATSARGHPSRRRASARLLRMTAECVSTRGGFSTTPLTAASAWRGRPAPASPR